jgi:exonuclease VII large subunit
VAIDGTKIMANASRDRSASYQKLTEREQYWKETVDKLMADAQRTDQEEDEKWGKGQKPEALPPDLSDAKRRLARIQQAKAELEREAQEMLKEAQQNFTPRKPGRPAKGQDIPAEKTDPQQYEKVKARLRRARKNAESPTREYNFVDPDSRLMMDTGRNALRKPTTLRSLPTAGLK